MRKFHAKDRLKYNQTVTEKLEQCCKVTDSHGSNGSNSHGSNFYRGRQQRNHTNEIHTKETMFARE